MNMSKNITDIANWKKEYPFLNEVWEFYNKFDIITVEDKFDRNIYSLCHMILKEFGKHIGVYDSFCLKLLNNLGHYSENKKSFIHSHDRCNILYNWIYNSKMKHNIPDEIINKCFEEYNTASKLMKYSDACSYNLHNTFYEEPINITLLDIFDNNTPIIKAKLMNQDESISTPCRKYVCECVKIYEDMHQKYCLNGEEGNKKHENTCSRLKNFKNTYTWFFKDIQDLKDKIPSLDDIQNTYMPKCQMYVQEDPGQPVVAEDQHISSSRTPTQDSISARPASINLREGENQSSRMSSTVSTAFGTVAGTSSILALLYKFTPGRRWIHSGFGRQSGRIDNNLYAEGPNELLFQGYESEDMSSYNARYNIGYGSA